MSDSPFAKRHPARRQDAALGEPAVSAATAKALRRVGRALGDRDGTTQDDDAALRAERQESRAEGFAEGRQLTREEMLDPLRGLLRRMVERRFGRSAARRARAWADGVDCQQTLLQALDGVADARSGTEFTNALDTYRQP